MPTGLIGAGGLGGSLKPAGSAPACGHAWRTCRRAGALRYTHGVWMHACMANMQGCRSRSGAARCTAWVDRRGRAAPRAACPARGDAAPPPCAVLRKLHARAGAAERLLAAGAHMRTAPFKADSRSPRAGDNACCFSVLSTSDALPDCRADSNSSLGILTCRFTRPHVRACGSLSLHPCLGLGARCV